MESSQSINPKEVYGPILGNRWVQLISAVIAMIMIANLQYAWTLFTPSLKTAFGTSLTAIQFGFTLFIWFETFAQPIEGYLLDRFGPRMFFTAAGVMVGVGWTGMGLVESLKGLYFFYALAGLGAGFIYGGSVAVAIRWFSDKRGLAAGIIAAGFGAGSAPFIPIIGSIIEKSGYQAAFISTGIFQGLVILIVAQLLRYPPGNQKHAAHAQVDDSDPNRGFKPWEVLRQPQFYLIYIMFLFMTIGGLMLTANAKPFAKDVGVIQYFVILGVTIDRIGNGGGRIFWGWLSDKFGRENIMFIGFTLNAIFTATFPFFGTSGWGYVIWMFLIMGTWGELFSLFPSLNADRFGTTFAASNYGLLYSAKGFGGILGGVVATAIASTYGWTVVFVGSGVLAFASALGALIVKKLPKPTRPGMSIDKGISEGV
ncbi:oxalate/formate MFS antiporter [Paradesulfitobacterium aromaticivorans]